MFDNYPYTTRAKFDGGIYRYYVSFTDGQAQCHEVEVSFPVYSTFEKFERIARNLRRWDERHRDNYEFAEETVYSRAEYRVMSAEDEVLNNMQDGHLREILAELPEKQRRRFVLWYYFGLTYEQIGEFESCTPTAVKYTIDKAREAISKKI